MVFNSTREAEGWRWDIDILMYYWIIRFSSGHQSYVYLKGEMTLNEEKNMYINGKEEINTYCPSEETLKRFTFKLSFHSGIDVELLNF